MTTEACRLGFGTGLPARGQLDIAVTATPIEKVFNESFNGRLRNECLKVHRFASIADAQTKIEAWRRDYNEHRPGGLLGHLTATEFVASGRS